MRAKKFVGPSKRMAESLEYEGLYITWPKAIKDNEDLCIEGTFLTGRDWEKLVDIDLRDEGPLKTKGDVDAAVSRQLEAEYEAFDINEEMNMYEAGRNGAPDAERLLEDIKEQEKRLERFADVAYAVARGDPIPPEEEESDNGEAVEVAKADVETIIRLLKTAAPDMEFFDRNEAVDIVNKLARSIGQDDNFNCKARKDIMSATQP